jgi:hypothetical protein
MALFFQLSAIPPKKRLNKHVMLSLEQETGKSNMSQQSQQYPHLQECYIAIAMDSNESEVDFAAMLLRTGLGSTQLEIAEGALDMLTPAERETLAVGDQEDWSPIFQKCGEHQDIVHMVLDAMFSDSF